MKWRGDLPFSADPFNEVDALILARLSYLDLHGIVDESDTEYNIQDVQRQYQETLSKRFIHFDQDVELFKAIANSKRFHNLKITHYIEHTDDQKFKQFAAVTFIIDYKMGYLSFRGTDATFNGWREDLDMTYADKIPSQTEAVNYLNHAIKVYPFKHFYIGGHSKGGNLAIAALAMQSDLKVGKKVETIYSFDGPGFPKEIIATNAYQAALPKVTNFIPQSSIVGKLLGHEEKLEIIFSNATGIYQHDIYSWEVIANHFNHQQSLTISSHLIDKTFDDYLDSLSKAQKEEVVSVIFEIIAASQMDTTRDFTKNFFKIAPDVIGKMLELKSEDYKLLSEAITVIKNSFMEAAGQEFESYRKAKVEETEDRFFAYIQEKYGNPQNNIRD